MKEIIISKINEIAESANAELAKVTENGFPFSLAEVRLSWSMDSAGVYVRSGETPVCALARTGNPFAVVDEIRRRVMELIAATRTAVERRGGLKKEMDALASDGDQRSRAIAALEAAGLDPALVSGGIDRHSAEMVVAAAEEAVAAANRNPPLGAVRYRDWKLVVKGFIGGVAVLAGGKPCFITRFPRVTTPETISRMATFIREEILALGQSRRIYYAALQAEIEREERLNEIARRLDSAEESLAAAM